MSLELTRRFLGASAVGLFGAGHPGGALAKGLLDGGLPRLSDAERKRYLVQAATPGGVTDAIFSALKTGMTLSAALEQGIKRSRELAEGESP